MLNLKNYIRPFIFLFFVSILFSGCTKLNRSYEKYEGNYHFTITTNFEDPLNSSITSLTEEHDGTITWDTWSNKFFIRYQEHTTAKMEFNTAGQIFNSEHNYYGTFPSVDEVEWTRQSDSGSGWTEVRGRRR